MPLEQLNSPTERANHIEEKALERLRAYLGRANKHELRRLEHALHDVSIVVAAERMRRMEMEEANDGAG